MVFYRPLTKLKYLIGSIRHFHKTHVVFGALCNAPNAELDKRVYDRYMCLPIPECKVQLTYLWIDHTGENLRSKTRTLDFSPSTYKEVPIWNFNGFHTMKAPKEKSDYYLVPVSLYNDPIRRGANKIVLCETFDADEKPCKTNHRQKCVEALNKVCDHEVYIGFEQDYYIMGSDGRPFGWPPMGEPISDRQYYASMCTVIGREITECIYRALLYAGVNVYSDCAEPAPSQWELKTNGERGVKPADDMWFSRWLMQRIAEDFGLCISFQPFVSPRWSKSGLHVTYSTKKMRDNDGMKYIQETIKKLEKCHTEMLKIYKSTYLGDKFTSGIGDRTASVRIPKIVADKKKGFIEDRRPAGNADPYKIMEALIKACI
nr:unnamed protein product [Callosobruchus chinensis]